MSEWERGFSAGWDAAMRAANKYGSLMYEPTDRRTTESAKKALKRSKTRKGKRTASAYSKRYGKAFKRLAPKYKKKAGGWKKNGFKLCATAARKAAKK